MRRPWPRRGADAGDMGRCALSAWLLLAHPLGARRIAALASLLAVLGGQACRAEDVTPFRLTGIEGHVVVDYLHDSTATAQGGLAPGTTTQTQSNLREDVFVMSHSYVYHPNFLTLDIGGGPVRQDSGIEVNGVTTDAGETLYNFTGRASLLRGKPLHGALFYDHLNPTVSVAPGEILPQESTRYGADLGLSGARTPAPLDVSFARTQTRGRGTGRLLDDDLAQFNFNVSRSFGALGATSMHYQTSDQTSASGSLNLPIQSSASSSRGLNVDTRLHFGANDAYDLTHHVTLNRRRFTLAGGELPQQGDASMLLDLRARPSKRLAGFATYRLGRNDQGSDALASHVFAAGLTHLPLPDLETSLGARVERSDASQFALSTRVVDGSLRYKRPVRVGSVQASYAVRYEQRDQQAANPLVDIVDEQLTLTGVAQVALNHTHVVPGSVVVTNLTQTQTFVENVDYLLVVIGAETRVQRLVAGSILDGESVLADYRYDLGGSYASAQLDQTLHLNWSVSRFMDTYLRWFDAAPEITSGVSTFPLNRVRSLLLGLRGEAPLRLGVPVSVGGSYESETRRETISPYRRDAGDVFVQTSEPLLGLANLRLTARRSRIRYELSTQDVDLTGYELRLWARRFGIDLVGAASYEQDLGGVTPRTRQDGSINAIWRERKVTVSASLVAASERQGGFEREHVTLHVTARRDF